MYIFVLRMAFFLQGGSKGGFLVLEEKKFMCLKCLNKKILSKIQKTPPLVVRLRLKKSLGIFLFLFLYFFVPNIKTCLLDQLPYMYFKIKNFFTINTKDSFVKTIA